MSALPLLVGVANNVVAAAQDPDQLRSVIDKAGPIAGLFVLALGIALFFLFRSMNKQMKKISPDLPEGPDDKLQAEDRRLTEEAVERGEDEAQGNSSS